MKETKLTPIFSMNLAGILMTKGFVLVKMKPNTNDSGKNVFYFKYSPELMAIVDSYKLQ